MAVSGLSATFSQAYRPTDANKRLIGIGQRKFVRSPWLVLGASFATKFVAELGGHGINILEIQIEAERLFPRHEPGVHRLSKMKVPTLAI
jgi:hypothetical protein